MKSKMSSSSLTGGRGGFLPGLLRCFSEITVEPVLFLYMLSTFSQYALFQDLVYTKVCHTKYNETVCSSLHDEHFKTELNSVQTDSSHWILLSTVTLVIPSLLITIYLGSWSDRFGRKWPVVLPPLGGAFSCLIYIIISFEAKAPVAWILVASSVSGLSGGFVSCIMSCMTYVAAVSSPENRTVRISRLEAMTFLGGTIGPFISGSMLQVTGHGYAFCFMMVSYLLACLYAIMVVKDIHDPSVNRSKSKRQRNKSINRRTHEPVWSIPPDQHQHQVHASEEVPSKSDINVYPDENIEHGPNKDGTNSSRLLYSLPENNSGNNIIEISSSSNPIGVGVGVVGKPRWDRSNVWSGGGGGGGGSAGSNSSTSTCDGCSSSSSRVTQDDLPSDDERGNIIVASRKSKSNTTSGITRRNDNSDNNINSNSSSSRPCCCATYFGSVHFTDALTTAFRKREGNTRLYLILVVIAGFISMMATAGELDVAYLFAKDKPLTWSYQTYSYYFGFKYGLGAFMLLVGMPIFLKLQLDDTTICIIGLISRMAGLVFYGLSSNTVMAFLVPVVAIFSFFTIPATRALLSKLVAPSEHGKMFAFFAIMEDLCTLSASVLFNSVYPITRSLYRGFVFYMAATLLLIPLLIIWIVRRNLVLKNYEDTDRPRPSPSIAINKDEHVHDHVQNGEEEEDEEPEDLLSHSQEPIGP